MNYVLYFCLGGRSKGPFSPTVTVWQAPSELDFHCANPPILVDQAVMPTPRGRRLRAAIVSLAAAGNIGWPSRPQQAGPGPSRSDTPRRRMAATPASHPRPACWYMLPARAIVIESPCCGWTLPAGAAAGPGARPAGGPGQNLIR